MRVDLTYSVKISAHKRVFHDTVAQYRAAVSFFLEVCLKEWELIGPLHGQKQRVNMTEALTVKTKTNIAPVYDFSERFYKFPCYLRRAAIAEALGKVSSYKSLYANWEAADPDVRGKEPGHPTVGYVYPALYRDNMFIRTDTYTAFIKVYIRNTWDWIEVGLKKSDADYIRRHCRDMKECVPTLQKRGKRWYLDFAFRTRVTLTETEIGKQRILAADLGLNSACACAVMDPKDAVAGRRFLHLPAEYDSLHHAIGHIKHAQRLCARRMPRLWAQAKGINRDIAVETSQCQSRKMRFPQ